MRPLIALALLALAAAGGCDRQSPQGEQPATGNRAAAAASPPPAAKPEGVGKIDRSHKGEAAPAFAFTAPDGARRTLADYRGTPVLVNLWATWCAPCKAEMPTLETLAAREAGQLHVLAISQDLTGAEAVAPYWQEGEFKALTLLYDPEVRMSMQMAATLPMTILYDRDGREIWRMTGGMDWSGEAAGALVAEGNR